MVALYVDAVDQGFAFANLRGRPNTGSSIQGTLPQGTRIDAVAKSVTGADGRHWYRVAYGSRRGYVLGALLNRQQPTALVTLYVNGADYGTPASSCAQPPTQTRLLSWVSTMARAFVSSRSR